MSVKYLYIRLYEFLSKNDLNRVPKFEIKYRKYSCAMLYCDGWTVIKKITIKDVVCLKFIIRNSLFTVAYLKCYDFC